MDVAISVSKADDSGDTVRALRSWLVEEDALRGRVRLVTPPPEPGTLGTVIETLAIAVGPGGAATVLVTSLLAWLRRQRGNITVKMSRPDGASLEVSAQNVKLDETGIRQLTSDVLRFLDGTSDDQK